MALWLPVISLQKKCAWGKCSDTVTHPRVFCEKHLELVKENSLWYPTERGDYGQTSIDARG